MKECENIQPQCFSDTELFNNDSDSENEKEELEFDFEFEIINRVNETPQNDEKLENGNAKKEEKKEEKEEKDDWKTVKKPQKPVSKPKKKCPYLCKHFLNGKCPQGDNCHFAHSADEVKPEPCRHGKFCNRVKYENGVYKNTNKGMCKFKHPDESITNYLTRFNFKPKLLWSSQNQLLQTYPTRQRKDS